jgi:cytochrome b561
VSWFGLFQLPDLVAKDKGVVQPAGNDTHDVGRTLGGVVALHVGAALKHHFMLRTMYCGACCLTANKTQGSER